MISTVAALGLAIAVVACTGDDGNGSSTGDDPGPIATDAPTTDPSSEGEPDESEPDLDTLEAEIAAAYDVRYVGYWECLRVPERCNLEYLVSGSPSAEGMTVTIEGLIDRDRFVGEEDVGYFVILDVDLIEPGLVAVEACWWSTAVLYGAPIDPSNPISSENPATVVNDTPGSAVLSDQFALQGDGRWLLAESVTLEEHPRENKCV